MKPNYTHITFVLDRSGSMGGVRNATIENFNAFIKDQQAQPGEATFSFFIFSGTVEAVDSFIDLQKLLPLTSETYQPSGSTALRDAIGNGIKETGLALSNLPEDQRPSKIIFVILTDGEENSSVIYTANQINELINEHQNVWNWQFVFLGANHDAVAAGMSYGISAQSSVTFTNDSATTTVLYQKMSAKMSDYRAGSASGVGFTIDDRKDLNKK